MISILWASLCVFLEASLLFGMCPDAIHSSQAVRMFLSIYMMPLPVLARWYLASLKLSVAWVASVRPKLLLNMPIDIAVIIRPFYGLWLTHKKHWFLTF